jgi:hypothetical protein
MKLAVATMILWTGVACAAQTPTARPPRAVPPRALERIVEARHVRLGKPVLFWREGREVAAQSVVLLRVKVGDPFLFAPRGAMEPLFVYGKTVCARLLSPFPGGEAVLMAPPPGPGEPALLWLAPAGLAPEAVDAKLVKRRLPKGSDLGRGRALRVNPARDASGRVYRDVEELRQEVLERRER